MRFNFRNGTILFVLVAISLASFAVVQAKPVKTRTAAIQVMKIRSEAIALPQEFQVSLYENLIAQLQKKAAFQHVYRDGDQNAGNTPELITLDCSVIKFKKGSETLRQVTTIAGATSMTLRCEFKDKEGNSLLVKDIEGKVRFFGGSLKATNDFAKKAAKLADEKLFSAPARS